MAVTDEQGHYALKVIGTDGKTTGAVIGVHRVKISTADLVSGSGSGDVASHKTKERSSGEIQHELGPDVHRPTRRHGRSGF